MEFKEFLSSLSTVDTVVGLVAIIILGFLGYLVYSQKYKMNQIANIVGKSNNAIKADLARDLSGVISSEKISKLSKENSYDFIKLKLKEESNRFESKMKLLKQAILFLFIIILGLLVKEYFIDFQNYKDEKLEKTTNIESIHVKNGDAVIGDGNTINHFETNEKDSIE